MKRIIFFQILLALLIGTSGCFAQEAYLVTKLGYSFLKNMELTDKDPDNGVVEGELSYSNGVALNAELGLEIDNIRAGVEGGFGINKLDSAQLTFKKSMLHKSEEINQNNNDSASDENIYNVNVTINVAKDFPLGNTFTPYVGCGIGYVIISEGYTDTTEGYSAYQFEMGGKFRLSKKYELGLGYRWLFTGQNPTLDLTINNQTHNLKTEYSQHIVFAGLVMNLLE